MGASTWTPSLGGHTRLFQFRVNQPPLHILAYVHVAQSFPQWPTFRLILSPKTQSQSASSCKHSCPASAPLSPTAPHQPALRPFIAPHRPRPLFPIALHRIPHHCADQSLQCCPARKLVSSRRDVLQLPGHHTSSARDAQANTRLGACRWATNASQPRKQRCRAATVRAQPSATGVLI